MVYILEQRLHAQNIPDKKSVRVLRDVVKTMYNPKFIHELFVPQKHQTMKQIYELIVSFLSLLFVYMGSSD